MLQICFLKVTFLIYQISFQVLIIIATVRGVDIFPPPVSWMPPNCILEVDDVLREWTWREPFDFIHLRILLGAFTAKEWDIVYQKCYEWVLFFFSDLFSFEFTFLSWYSVTLNRVVGLNSWSWMHTLNRTIKVSPKAAWLPVGEMPLLAVQKDPVAELTLSTQWDPRLNVLGLLTYKRNHTSGPSEFGPGINSSRRLVYWTTICGQLDWKDGECGFWPSSARQIHGPQSKSRPTWGRFGQNWKILALMPINERKFSSSSSYCWVLTYHFQTACLG